MNGPAWSLESGDGPLVAAAVHDGALLRPEVSELILLDDRLRRYEEDPHTAEWTWIAPTRIVGLRSRFEFDLNRPREKAVYITPDDAWGLDVWRAPPSAEVIERSLAMYDDFYAHVELLLDRLLARYRRVVVFDLHSFNCRRDGENAEIERQTPDINLGTKTMDRRFWAPVVDAWLAAMQQYDFRGRRLDVRENVNFFGGNFPRRIHASFPRRACVLAIEVKKFFMDEWTGKLDVEEHRCVGEGLRQAAERVRIVLERDQ